MKDTTLTHIAYRCPKCTDAVLGLVGRFAVKADMVRLKCSCGEHAADIKPKSNGRLSVSAPCILCNANHEYTVAENIFFEKKSLNLPCPYALTDVFFIGEGEAIDKELRRTGEQLTEIVKGFDAEDVHDLQPTDVDEADVLPDPAVYDTLRFVVKDLESDGKISCPCSFGSYELRFTDTGLQVYCSACGATYDFPVISPSLAEEYLGLDSLTLK